MSRRSFLRTSAVLASGLAALAASLSPLRELDDQLSLERLVQKYYKELTPEEMNSQSSLAEIASTMIRSVRSIIVS